MDGPPESSANPVSEQSELARELGSFSLLDGLDPATLLTLAATCQTRDLERGAVIFRQGDPADGVYFLRRGRVDIVFSDAAAPQFASTSVAGDCFGELAPIGDEPRATAAIWLRNDGRIGHDGVA